VTERRAWAAVGLLAVLLVVLRLPTVTVGLHMDDLAQRAMVEGAYPVARAPWDLYTFSSGEPAEVRTLVGAGALPAVVDDPGLGDGARDHRDCGMGAYPARAVLSGW
jgi:hypothetical protein